jgi:putative nucleotidyltransferase with HDIG domain
MSESAFIESERLRASFAGRAQRLVSAERRGELSVGAGFLIAALALALLAEPDRSFSLPLAVLYVMGVAAIGHVRFEIGSGFTVPTQVVFVPMLFALPVSLVPLLVVLSLALGMVPAILSGRIPVSRILTVPANSWFAVGPSLVLLLAHDQGPNGDWGILMLALMAQFVCDFSANAARERLRNGIGLGDLAREVRPIYLIDLALAPLGLVVAIATIADPWAVLLIAPLFGVLQWFSKERHARIEQLIELNDAYHGTALLLGDVVEADDSYTGAHCKEVVRLAREVARRFELDPDRSRRVEFAALLHDVGKIAVPKEIVNKPGKLDEHEWEIIKTHTVEGQKMLEQVGGFMGEVGEIVRSHHERWDGGGYPDGLRGEQIPLEARIVSCCDTFNAMTTTRAYRRAMSVEVALDELRANAGSQLDPAVVDVLVALIEDDRG